MSKNKRITLSLGELDYLVLTEALDAHNSKAAEILSRRFRLAWWGVRK